MKKIFITALATLVAGFGFSAENSVDHFTRRSAEKPWERGLSQSPEPRSREREEEGNVGDKIALGVEKTGQIADSISTFLEKAPDTVEKVTGAVGKLIPKRSYFYFRMNVADSYPGGRSSLIPGVGAGYRKTAGSSAIDFSAGYTRGGNSKPGRGKSEFITLPKISYFYYLSPVQSQSLYVGPGIAFGRIKTREGNRFQGLIPSASLGYEISRKAALLSFFQLDLSLPVLAAKSKGPMPGLMAEFAFGAGF